MENNFNISSFRNVHLNIEEHTIRSNRLVNPLCKDDPGVKCYPVISGKKPSSRALEIKMYENTYWVNKGSVTKRAPDEKAIELSTNLPAASLLKVFYLFNELNSQLSSPLVPFPMPLSFFNEVLNDNKLVKLFIDCYPGCFLSSLSQSHRLKPNDFNLDLQAPAIESLAKFILKDLTLFFSVASNPQALSMPETPLKGYEASQKIISFSKNCSRALAFRENSELINDITKYIISILLFGELPEKALKRYETFKIQERNEALALMEEFVITD